VAELAMEYWIEQREYDMTTQRVVAVSENVFDVILNRISPIAPKYTVQKTSPCIFRYNNSRQSKYTFPPTWWKKWLQKLESQEI
jgi:hypothetical protein